MNREATSFDFKGVVLPLIIGVEMSKLTALNTLKEKLGEDGVDALFEVLEEERERIRDYLFRILEERFVRRLAEEIGKLRSEMYKLFAQHSTEVDEKIENLRSEMTEKIEGLRTEMTEKIEGLRTEMTEKIEGLRTEMMEKIEGLRSEMHDEIGKLRAEMTEKIEKLRSEMHDEIGKLRAEMYRELAKVWNEIGKLRAEVQKVRSDIIRWMFVLAISQTVAIISVIVAIMRLLK